jgi:hypothetical protein
MLWQQSLPNEIRCIEIRLHKSRRWRNFQRNGWGRRPEVASTGRRLVWDPAVARGKLRRGEDKRMESTEKWKHKVQYWFCFDIVLNELLNCREGVCRSNFTRSKLSFLTRSKLSLSVDRIFFQFFTRLKV